ncbi:hypothetical protein M1295_01490 [Patescibacteria group bacterium]|nr:hypothetical protein [Patescibacteria group bacterium]
MQLNDTSTTLNGIKQDIYFIGKITASTFTTGDLNRIINKYYKQAQAVIRAVNEDFFMEIATATLLATTGGTYPNEYLFPDDYEKIKQIQVAFTPAIITAPVSSEFQILHLVGQESISDPSAAITIPTAIILDNSFFLYPDPSLGSNLKLPVTGGVKCFYIKKQADLVNDADVPNIFSDYQDVISWGSLIDIAARLGNQTLLNEALAMFTKRIAEMRSHASQRVLELSSPYTDSQSLGGWAYPHGQNSMS